MLSCWQKHKWQILSCSSQCRRLSSLRSSAISIRRAYSQDDSTTRPVNPRITGIGNPIEDEYATIRENYRTPKNPIVLAHGLLGFDELHLAGRHFPGIHYWRGIKEALMVNGIEVITASVPASASIEQRAARLSEDIYRKAPGKSVNIIAGLDSRYMISQMKPPNVKVLSLTTIATPHRGSAFADFAFRQIGGSSRGSVYHVMADWDQAEHIPRLYKALGRFKLESGAFSQLTREYMAREFNPKTPDRADVRYFSYGATIDPSFWSIFRQSHRVVEREEGPNDGLVSVASSQWGSYKGTLSDVSHLELINWTNRLRLLLLAITGNKRKFNAIAFYLSIADMLAEEGL